GGMPGRSGPRSPRRWFSRRAFAASHLDLFERPAGFSSILRAAALTPSAGRAVARVPAPRLPAIVRSGQQAGDDAREKDAVERARAADRDERRPELGDLVEIQEVGADQRAHGARDVREWRGAPELEQQADARSERSEEHTAELQSPGH